MKKHIVFYYEGMATVDGVFRPLFGRLNCSEFLTRQECQKKADDMGMDSIFMEAGGTATMNGKEIEFDAYYETYFNETEE